MYDIIIVGGGAAGLMAAKILSGKNKKILLLEAKEKLGGRIQKIENVSFHAEAGAEFIHGNLKTTFDVLKEAGLKKQKVKGNFCRVVNGKWTMNEEQILHWDILVKKLRECKNDITIDDFLDKFFKAKKYDDLKKQFKRYVQGYDAADTKYTNVFAIRKEMEDEDENQYRPVPGYSAMIDFLEETCRKNKCIIKINEPVRKVIYKKSVYVTTTTGKYIARKIIIAVPLGVMQSKRGHENFIEFPSLLKKYITATRKIGNGGVIKIVLEFDKAFWLDKNFLCQKNIEQPSYIFTEQKIPTWWSQDSSKLPTLTGWLGGPASFKMKNFSEKKFKKIILESLSSIFFLPVKEVENRIKNYAIINWIREPYILGGYSYSTLETESARKLLQTPFEDAFYFAGEYVEKNSTSTVEDALLTGKQAALLVLATL